jgi:hypothetical protein
LRQLRLRGRTVIADTLRGTMSTVAQQHGRGPDGQHGQHRRDYDDEAVK